MLSALHAKSKVYKAAVSAGWNFNWSTQLTGRRALATETKFECKKKPNKKKQKKTNKENKIKQLWGFGGGWQPAASPLNLQLGSGPVHHALITFIKKTRHKLLKNIRTSVQKTHSQITHTYLGCLPHLLLCWFSHLILIYWTDIWTFLFLFIVTLSISFYLCLPPFILSSFFFLLAHLLWVGSAHALLVSDPLADQILRCLCGGWWPCYGDFTVPRTRNELSLFRDLDAGSR